MEDVAERAGMSRQHLYRSVASRPELLELALLARVEEIVQELEAGTDPSPPDVAEAIVDYLRGVIDLGRHDDEFIALADAVPRLSLNALLTGESSPINAMAARSFVPLLDAARERGLLREHLDDDIIVTSIQGVVTFLTPQTDLPPERQDKLIRWFVVPGIIDTTRR
jgi:AcrR family transcriptional regulator